MTVTSGVTCPSCEGQKVDFVGELQNSHWFAGRHLEDPLPGGSLYHCSHCFLKFRYPAQNVEVYQHLYDNSSITTWSSEILRPDWVKIVQYVHTAFPDGGKVLDFGCYSGGLLANLGEQYEKYGVEINQSAADVAAKRNHATIWQSLDDIPKEMRFDFIISADVVEHVLDPGSLINRLIELLGKDGVLIITTGDAHNYLWKFLGANWWYCFYSEHISFISKPWLEHFCKVNRVVILQCEKFVYYRLSTYQLVREWALTIFYGVAPTLYINMGSLWKKIMRRKDGVGPRGSGISADHIFVILGRKDASL